MNIEEGWGNLAVHVINYSGKALESYRLRPVIPVHYREMVTLFGG